MQSTNVDSLLRRLIEHWRMNGAAAAPPCSEEDLSAFEHRQGVTLPIDLRRFFLAANGMDHTVGLGKDAEGFRFWSLEELIRADLELQRRSPTSVRPPDASDFYAFADYMDWSWAYAIKLRGEVLGSIVLIGGPGEVCRVAGSLREFVEQYLTDTTALIPHES